MKTFDEMQGTSALCAYCELHGCGCSEFDCDTVEIDAYEKYVEAMREVE